MFHEIITKDDIRRNSINYYIDRILFLKEIFNKLIKEEMEDNYYNLIEELEFVDSNILKDIRGEK